jgi:hypothetical protein
MTKCSDLFIFNKLKAQVECAKKLGT